MSIRKRLLARPGKRLKLVEWDPDETLGFKKDDAEKALEASIERLDELQYRMYAEHRHALLVVLQGMDASGKDGTIRHVMRGLNPQGCRVVSFKEPSTQEKNHDFLWRVHPVVPARGDIAIFNRSHYEDVLIARVHNLVPKDVWSRRYEEINAFEKLLSDEGTTVVKFFLHISKEEQKRRFEGRLKDPARQWKLAPGDFEERRYWRDYMDAYEDALRLCSTAEAPWYVVPANKKWVRNLAVSQVLVETLETMRMKFPKPSFDVKEFKLQ